MLLLEMAPTSRAGQNLNNHMHIMHEFLYNALNFASAAEGLVIPVCRQWLPLHSQVILQGDLSCHTAHSLPQWDGC